MTITPPTPTPALAPTTTITLAEFEALWPPARRATATEMLLSQSSDGVNYGRYCAVIIDPAADGVTLVKSARGDKLSCAIAPQINAETIGALRALRDAPYGLTNVWVLERTPVTFEPRHEPVARDAFHADLLGAPTEDGRAISGMILKREAREGVRFPDPAGIHPAPLPPARTKVATPAWVKTTELVDDEYATAEKKRRALAAFTRFVDSGFEGERFTRAVYDLLTVRLDFIAHYDLGGFFAYYFENGPAGVREFFDELHHAIGVRASTSITRRPDWDLALALADGPGAAWLTAAINRNGIRA
ncbi:hypothetical protein V6N00_13045 [Tersicoccus sp. MR15.9]|uniref:hypothetical protein n=1 Tax=Tersicoccus mangrovi TaxID=3121635 RepID=UPI002FE5D79B